MSELVKIDPKSIGVGQYQHDMNQKQSGREPWSGVVEDCVNKVGVDLNTASASLLEYISGINKALAKNIVAYREEQWSRFTNRKQLLKVAKLGPKAFEQCAGFLRISGGENPLDATSVHPESYQAATEASGKAGIFQPGCKKGRPCRHCRRKIRDYKEPWLRSWESGRLPCGIIVERAGKTGQRPQRRDAPSDSAHRRAGDERSEAGYGV